MHLRTSMFLFVLILAAGPANAFSGLFEAPFRTVPYPLLYGSASAVGDLNADGKPDLVIGGYGPPEPSCGKIALWKGDGSGNFTMQGIAGAPCVPSAIAIADLNGDGWSEIVVAGEGAVSQGQQGGIRVYYSAAGVDLLTTGHFLSVAVGNLDGGKLASIVAGRGGDSLAVVLHPTSLTSFVPTDIPLCRDAKWITLADLDEDGFLDIAAAGLNAIAGSEVCAARGHGDGTFAAPTFSNVRGSTVGLALGDFNGDGVGDVVTVSTVSDFAGDRDIVTVHLGNGQAGFGGRIETTAPSKGSKAIEALDFDHDEKLDVCIHRGSSDLFLHGNGDGSFGATSLIAVPALAFVPAGDVDGDGIVDRLGSSGSDVIVRPFLLPGDPSPPEHRLPERVDNGEVADLDGDGWNDLLVTSDITNPGVFVLPNDHGTLAAPVRLGTGSAKSVRAEDLDGNGRLDVVWVGSSGMSIVLQQADGTFGPARILDTPAGASDLELADLDEDGELDAVVATRSGAICVWNDFAAMGSGVRTDTPIPGPAVDVAVGDWNEDGILDLAVAIDGDSFTPQPVLLGDGTGHFVQGTPVAIGGFRIAICAGDLDGDGHEDLAYGGVLPNWNVPTGGEIVIARGAGNGTFQPGVPHQVSEMPARIEARDLDEDGDLDLVCGGTACVLMNPAGQFGGYGPTAREAFGSSTPMSRVVVGDLTGDGVPDLVSNTNLLPGRRPTIRPRITLAAGGSALPGAGIAAVATVSNPAPNPRRLVVEWRAGRAWPGAAGFDTLDVPANGVMLDTITVAIPDSAAEGIAGVGGRVHVQAAPALADSAADAWTILSSSSTGGSIALAPIGGNPGTGPPGILLTAPPGIPVTIDLLSVLGRVIERRTVADAGGQSIEVKFQTTTAGVYFIRARQSGLSTSIRFVVLP